MKYIYTWLKLSLCIVFAGLFMLWVTIKCYVIPDAEYTALSALGAVPVGAVTQSMLNSATVFSFAVTIFGVCCLVGLSWFKNRIG
jgi:hypothetical protein